MNGQIAELNIAYLADYPEYLPQIARWQHDEFGYLNPLSTLSQRTARLETSLQTQTLPMTLIALSSAQEVIGCAGIFPSSITHQHLTPWLSSVYVPAEYRAKGIASALSLRAVAEAARLGHERIYLFTPKSKSLYASLGWVEFDTSVHRGTQLTLMERSTAQRAIDMA